MYGWIRKVLIALWRFSGSLASMAHVSNFITCISLNNLPYMTRPTLTNLNINEYNQGLRYDPFMVNLAR